MEFVIVCMIWGLDLLIGFFMYDGLEDKLIKCKRDLIISIVIWILPVKIIFIGIVSFVKKLTMLPSTKNRKVDETWNKDYNKALQELNKE